MIPTKTNVLDAARFYLGDDLVSGGQIFTNTILEQPFNMAYRELFRALQGVANPRVRREAFYTLPAYTTVLAPATASITDMGELEYIEERGGMTNVAITNAVNGAGFVTITAAGHPFSTGDIAVIYGILGMVSANGMYGVTVSSSSAFTLNGAVGPKTYVSGGIASKSTEPFLPMTQRDRIGTYTTGGTLLSEYAWFEDVLHFPICTAARQLRIAYISSAADIVAVGDTTGIDDSLDFLALRTAGLAASSRGAFNRAEELNGMAIGVVADGTGGILRELVVAGVRAMQANPTRRPPFRERSSADLNFL